MQIGQPMVMAVPGSGPSFAGGGPGTAPSRLYRHQQPYQLVITRYLLNYMKQKDLYELEC
jgi:hypothetical protein